MLDFNISTVVATPAPAVSTREAIRPLVEALVEGLLASMMPAIQPAAAPVVETTVEPAAEPAAEPAEEPVAEPVVEAAAAPVVETTVEPAAEPATELVGGMTDNEVTNLAIMTLCMEALAASVGKDNGRRTTALADLRGAFMKTTGAHDDELVGAAEALMRGSTKRWRAQRASVVDNVTDLVGVA